MRSRAHADRRPVADYGACDCNSVYIRSPCAVLRLLGNRLVHHVVLVYCHGAAGSVAGAACAGLTDAGGLPGVEGIRLISLAGYCAEVPNVLLNSRWYGRLGLAFGRKSRAGPCRAWRCCSSLAAITLPPT